MHAIKFKLFHGALTRSARVKWLLHEIVGDAFDLQYVDLGGGEQYGADYLAINPNHAVPTLAITLDNGGTINMIESAAMIALLADAYPKKGLAPPPAPLSLARADYLQVLHFAASMDAMLWQIRLHENILADAEREPRTARRYREKFAAEVEPQLRRRFEATSFVCGDTFSAADCPVAHGIMWAQSYGLCADAVFSRYLAAIRQRPAFAAAFSDADRFVRDVPRRRPIVSKVTG